MLFALVIFLAGMTIMSAVLGMRALDAWQWSRSLVALKLRLPATLTADDVSHFLEVVAATTHPPKWSLLPYPPIAFEIVATHQHITHYVLAPRALQSKLLSIIRATFPGVRVEEAPDYVAQKPALRMSAELKMTSTTRPLGDGRTETASAALLASMQPLNVGEEIHYQVIMTSAGTPAPIHSASTKSQDAWWASYLVEGVHPGDADAVRAARLKQRGPLLQTVVRLGVVAPSKSRAFNLFSRSWGALHTMNAPGVRLVRRWLPSSIVNGRIQNRMMPFTVWPLVINTRELPGLLGLPLGGISLPGLRATVARQLPPTPEIPQSGSVLALSNYPGMERRLAIPLTDRLRHLYLLGPTGVGKSTLIANLALQDIAAGHGLALIDPKSDLVSDVLSRIPEARRDDVIVLDPSATHQPVGFNLLGNFHNEYERELVVDHVVHIMQSLWRDSWGPRTSDVLRNSLLTLTHTNAPDGSAFTLAEIPELLMNANFRRSVTGQKGVPDSVRPFWYAYDQMSDGERTNVIGPSLNKLRQFTTRTPLRLMLGQSGGIDVADVFRKRRILLVPLSKGTLGTDTAQLLGALLVASLWQATLSRARIPAEHRRPAFIYLDEFQDVLRLPLDTADMLAQARGLGVGVVLAHQHLGQLPDAVKTAVLGTARSQVVFQLDHDDARTLAARFAPLTADDLMGLDAHEVALRLSVGGRTLSPVTGSTMALPPSLDDGQAVARASQARYGTLRAEVEAALRARVAGSDDERRLGRRTRGGAA
jgi:hypothetical protein